MTLLAASASPTPAAKASQVPAGAAVIVNSGSTNTSSYRVIVEPDGTAHIEIASRDEAKKTLVATTAKGFFESVRAAMPLDAIKTVPCMKSASFGTSTFVRYAGKQSPDLGCATGTAASRLAAEVAKVTSELGLGVVLRSGGPHVIQASSPPPTP